MFSRVLIAFSLVGDERGPQRCFVLACQATLSCEQGPSHAGAEHVWPRVVLHLFLIIHELLALFLQEKSKERCFPLNDRFFVIYFLLQWIISKVSSCPLGPSELL